jgi:hypothetical protein
MAMLPATGIRPSNTNEESAFRRWWNAKSFLQKRMIRLCLSMGMLIICTPLYHLGFFGSVDGPLHPAHIGDALAAMGVTKTHAKIFFLSFLIITVSWNWIQNVASHLMGLRLTCNRLDERGNFCGTPVSRRWGVLRGTGAAGWIYACSKGHERPEAHFHPVQKGRTGHAVWLTTLAFCVIVFSLP